MAKSVPPTAAQAPIKLLVSVGALVMKMFVPLLAVVPKVLLGPKLVAASVEERVRLANVSCVVFATVVKPVTVGAVR